MLLHSGSSTREEPTKPYSWQKSICSEDRSPFTVGKHIGLGQTAPLLSPPLWEGAEDLTGDTDPSTCALSVSLVPFIPPFLPPPFPAGENILKVDTAWANTALRLGRAASLQIWCQALAGSSGFRLSTCQSSPWALKLLAWYPVTWHFGGVLIWKYGKE